MNWRIRAWWMSSTLVFAAISLAYSAISESCNFENMHECSWYFTNSYDLGRILKAQRASPASIIPQRTLYSSQERPASIEEDGEHSNVSKDSNFYVVVSGGANISNHYAYFLSRKKSDNVAMIVSPFYETTGAKCELMFRHRILGENGAELVVTTEQLTLSHAAVSPNLRGAVGGGGELIGGGNEAEDDDWVRPTLRARFLPESTSSEPWITSQIPIGTFAYPTRIRIECHATGQDHAENDLNVECHVDDLHLFNCEEELYQTDKCVSSKAENRKYLCSSNGKDVCLRYEDLCDMHPECADDEDENEELHSCSSVPAGGRCNFEDLREAVGCAGWHFYSGHSNSSARDKAHLVGLTSADLAASHTNRPKSGVSAAGKRSGLPPSEYNYRGKLYRPGHFLFFSSYNYATSSEHEIVYSSAISPFFPPISMALNLPVCVLRFFYCQAGSNPFQIFLVAKDRLHEPKPLWAPPKDETNVEPCEWKKASAVIRPSIDINSGSEYYVKLSFAKIPGSVGSIAIDDLSLTPSCSKHFPNWKPSKSSLNDTICHGERLKDGTCLDEFNDDGEKKKSGSFIFSRLSMVHFVLIVLLFNLIVLIVFLVVCCVWRRVVQSSAKNVLHMNDHEMLGMESETTSRCAGNKITGNPIYETLQLASLNRISRQSLQMNRIIGHGAFGEVYEGYYFHSGQRTTVAVKSLPPESSTEINDDFETEARLLSQFKHANIVAFYGVSFEQQPKYIVLEYLEGGDLKNFLRESRPKFGPAGSPFLLEEPNLRMTDLIGFALDVAKGCEHLEATKFVHRDIAARNCLLTSKAPGQRVVKIADFGMARDIYRNDYYRKGGKAFLPVRWMPPEAFLDGIFTTKTDIWAFGVLLWEIFSMGYVPYSGRENHEVMKLVVAGDRLDPPIGILSDIYEVMLMCWNTDAEKRPKFFNLITFFADLMKREDVLMEPIPPIRHRMLTERMSATPSTTAESLPIGEVVELAPNHAKASSVLPPTSTTLSSTTMSSQTTTMTTLPTLSQNGGGGGGGAAVEAASATSYDSMPTTGDGVCRNVFPPYEPKMSDPLMKMEAPSSSSGGGATVEQMSAASARRRARLGRNNFSNSVDDNRAGSRDSVSGVRDDILEDECRRTTASTSDGGGGGADSSASSHDDSTLHGSISSAIKYQVRPLNPTATMQNVPPIPPPKNFAPHQTNFTSHQPKVGDSASPTSSMSQRSSMNRGRNADYSNSHPHTTPPSSSMWRREGKYGRGPNSPGTMGGMEAHSLPDSPNCGDFPVVRLGPEMMTQNHRSPVHANGRRFTPSSVDQINTNHNYFFTDTNNGTPVCFGGSVPRIANPRQKEAQNEHKIMKLGRNFSINHRRGVDSNGGNVVGETAAQLQRSDEPRQFSPFV